MNFSTLSSSSCCVVVLLIYFPEAMDRSALITTITIKSSSGNDILASTII